MFVHPNKILKKRDFSNVWVVSAPDGVVMCCTSFQNFQILFLASYNVKSENFMGTFTFHFRTFHGILCATWTMSWLSIDRTSSCRSHQWLYSQHFHQPINVSTNFLPTCHEKIRFKSHFIQFSCKCDLNLSFSCFFSLIPWPNFTVYKRTRLTWLSFQPVKIVRKISVIYQDMLHFLTLVCSKLLEN